MFLVNRPRQHDDLAHAARRQHKPSLRRVHVGQGPKDRAKPSDFNAQARAVRFIGASPSSEGPGNERGSRHVSRPRFAERARKREQDRTPG